MLLCWACAALSGGLHASENHHRHCWLPLRSCWWVRKKNSQDWILLSTTILLSIIYLSCSVPNSFALHFHRFQPEPLWQSQQHLWEEHWPQGNCRSPPGLSLHCSVCLIPFPSVTLWFIICSVQHVTSTINKLEMHHKDQKKKCCLKFINTAENPLLHEFLLKHYKKNSLMCFYYLNYLNVNHWEIVKKKIIKK